MIQIDMPMPDNCDECRFNTEYGFCKAMPDNFCGNTDDMKRPEWFPLKEQELVRCSDCKNAVVYDDNEVVCAHIDSNGNDKHPADWFCADGVRAEGR